MKKAWTGMKWDRLLPQEKRGSGKNGRSRRPIEDEGKKKLPPPGKKGIWFARGGENLSSGD